MPKSKNLFWGGNGQKMHAPPSPSLYLAMGSIEGSCGHNIFLRRHLKRHSVFIDTWAALPAQKTVFVL